MRADPQSDSDDCKSTWSIIVDGILENEINRSENTLPQSNVPSKQVPTTISQPAIGKVTESKSKYVSRRRAIIAENRRKEYQNRHTANLKSEVNIFNDKPKLHYVRRTYSEIKAEEPITFDPTENNKNLSTTQPAISKIDV